MTPLLLLAALAAAEDWSAPVEALRLRPAVSGKAPAAAPALSGECRAFIAGLPPGFGHGFVQGRGGVPVFYYGRFDGGGAPVAFVNGGPGADSRRIFKRFAELVPPPFVFFDQRGTGCSGSFESAPADQFSSESIVRDMELIRKTLFGGRRWKVFGQSFGSLVVHRYVQTAPEGLAAGYAHGFGLMADPGGYREASKLYAAAAARRYYEAHPDDRARVAALLRRSCPGLAGEAAAACGARVLPDWGSRMIDPADWPKLREELARSEPRAAEEPQAAREEPEAPAGKPLSARETAIHTIVRQEYLPPSYDPADPFSCRRGRRALAARHPPEEAALFWSCDEYTGAKKELYARNVGLPVSYLSLAEFKRALEASPWVKFYLYSGEHDPYSPPPYFEDEARELKGRITYRLLPGGGHFDHNRKEVLEDLARE